MALALRDVSKTLGRRQVLTAVTADFRIGEMTLIRGARGSGKTTLARLLVGQTHPDFGDIRRDGLASPVLGSNPRFARSAPTLRALDLRAAAFGLDTRAYVRSIGELMDAPQALLEPFDRLRGRDRAVVTFASIWLLPARLFVGDGKLLPGDAAARDRVRPLWRAARERAAVVWIADLNVNARTFQPSRAARLERGRLIPEPPPV